MFGVAGLYANPMLRACSKKIYLGKFFAPPPGKIPADAHAPPPLPPKNTPDAFNIDASTLIFCFIDFFHAFSNGANVFFFRYLTST